MSNTWEAAVLRTTMCTEDCFLTHNLRWNSMQDAFMRNMPIV